jgi:hypothetical protein
MTWIKLALVPALLVALSGPPSFLVAQDPTQAVATQSAARQAPLDAAAVKVRAAVRAAHRGATIPSFRPSLKGINGHQADVGACNYENDRLRKLCRRGDRSSSRIIVLWGDSHARHWVPAVEAVAKRRGYAAYFFVKPACNAADTLRSLSPSLKPCIRFRAWVARQIKRMDPEILLVAGEMPPILLDAKGKTVSDEHRVSKLHARGLARAVRPLRSSVGKVVFFADVPGLRLTPRKCLSRPGNDVGDCTYKRPYRAILEARAAKGAATLTQENFLNPTKWFCYYNQCPTIVDHRLTYRDLGHVMPAYSRSLAPSLAKALQLGPIGT